jgi:glutamate formiminotransferase
VIETIPNVSEGRRPELLQELSAAVHGAPGALVLNESADPSHNRSVFTVAGTADAIVDAVMRLMAVAIAGIDLRTHRGVHPRIGALDVVPFVPLGGTSISECVTLSHTVGRAIAERWSVPVFLYEHSANRPERRRLEQIRRGQFEGLAAKMRGAEWAPDFGPDAPHPTAGATVIGARTPLIAFNVNLDTADLDTARHIAMAIRESSGGLRCVKALGVLLAHRNVAQVSMNLTDFTITPVQVAFEAVREEAARRGVGVLESELIGLIPDAALAGVTPEQLQLTRFSRASQVLEERIARLQERQAGSSSLSARRDGGMPNPRILR